MVISVDFKHRNLGEPSQVYFVPIIRVYYTIFLRLVIFAFQEQQEKQEASFEEDKHIANIDRSSATIQTPASAVQQNKTSLQDKRDSQKASSFVLIIEA